MFTNDKAGSALQYFLHILLYLKTCKNTKLNVRFFYSRFKMYHVFWDTLYVLKPKCHLIRLFNESADRRTTHCLLPDR